MNVPATASEETPVFFPAASEELFGVLTTPVGEPNGIAVVILPGGGWLPSTHRNRLSVRLARELAGAGFHAFRMEFHGAGESTGFVRAYRMSKPFVDDLEGAVRWMRAQGHDEFVFVGSCFGARTLLAAAERVPNVRGAILIAPPVRDVDQGTRNVDDTSTVAYARRLFSTRGFRGVFDSARRRAYGRILRRKLRVSAGAVAASVRRGRSEGSRAGVSATFLKGLDKLVRREIPTLFVYGERDEYYTWFRTGCTGALGRLLERAGSLVEIRVVPEIVVHAFTSLDAQQAVVSAVTDWLSERGARREPSTVRSS